jgi:hypothetical protein
MPIKYTFIKINSLLQKFLHKKLKQSKILIIRVTKMKVIYSNFIHLT